jgi:hypothetical protein
MDYGILRVPLLPDAVPFHGRTVQGLAFDDPGLEGPVFIGGGHHAGRIYIQAVIG